MTETGNFEIGVVGMKSAAGAKAAFAPQTASDATSENKESSFDNMLDSMRSKGACEKSDFARSRADVDREEAASENRAVDGACPESLSAETNSPTAKMAVDTDKVDEADEIEREYLFANDAALGAGGLEVVAEEIAQVALTIAPDTTAATAEVATVDGAAEALVGTDEPMPVEPPVTGPAKAEVSGEQKVSVDSALRQNVAEQGVAFEEAVQADAEAAKDGGNVAVWDKAVEVVAKLTSEAKPAVNPMLAEQRQNAAAQAPEDKGAPQREALHAVATQDAPTAEGAVVAASQSGGGSGVELNGTGVESEGSGLSDKGALNGGEANSMRGEIGRSDGVRNSEFLAKLDKAQETIRANQPEAAERMVKTMRMAFEKGESRVRIMLDPPQLGSVRVSMSFKDGVLNASFEAQTQAARHALAHDLPMLRNALENQGIEVGEFSVNVENGASQSQTFGETAGGSWFGGETVEGLVDGEEEHYDIFAEQRRIMGGTSVLDLIA